MISDKRASQKSNIAVETDDPKQAMQIPSKLAMRQTQIRCTVNGYYHLKTPAGFFTRTYAYGSLIGVNLQLVRVHFTLPFMWDMLSTSQHEIVEFNDFDSPEGKANPKETCMYVYGWEGTICFMLTQNIQGQ